MGLLKNSFLKNNVQNPEPFRAKAAQKKAPDF